MRAKFFGLGIGLALWAATAAGCSDDDNGGQEPGDDAGVTSSSSSSGGRPGNDAGTDAGPTVANDSFETARLLSTGEGGQLTPSDEADGDGYLADSIEPGKARYYYVELDDESAGYPMVAFVEGRGTEDTDESKHDFFISMYDESKTQIAANDDALYAYGSYRDPLLRTVPFTPGRYYFKVEPLCVHADANCPADWEDAVTDPSFRIGFGFANVDNYGLDNDGASDANGTPATAVAITPSALSGEGGILAYDSGLFGVSSSTTDLDYYKLNIPADLVVDANHRASLSIVFPAGGVNGTGASSTASSFWVVDSADTTKKLAVFDVKASLALENAETFGATASVPIQKAHDYYLVVQNADAANGNFYFASATTLSGNPLEHDGAAPTGDAGTDDAGVSGSNDTAATAEVLPVATGDDVAYFVEGDLSTPSDLDFFSVAVSGKTKVSVACGSQSDGSGLRGLTATVLSGATEVSTGTEDAAKGLQITEIAVPAGATTLTVKLAATSQATDVTGTFYRCGIHLD